MSLNGAITVPIEQVPAHLAALHVREFPWYRTPLLQQTAASMRSLCMAVFAQLNKESAAIGKNGVVHANRNVATEAAYTVLKEGLPCMTGKRKPEDMLRKVREGLEALLKKEVSLDESHPFESDPVFAGKTVRQVRHPISGRMTEKARYRLKKEPGYEDLVRLLLSGNFLKEFVHTYLPELLAPAGPTVWNFPTMQLAEFEKGASETALRSRLTQNIIGYCLHRYPGLSELIPAVTKKYFAHLEHEKAPADDAPDDLTGRLYNTLLKKAGDGLQFEKDIRPLLMMSLAAFANEGEGSVRRNGNVITVEQLIDQIALHEWPNLYGKFCVQYSDELEIAAMAALTRLKPLDELKEMIYWVEHPETATATKAG